MSQRWVRPEKRNIGDSWSVNCPPLVEDAGQLHSDKTYYRVDEYLRASGESK